MITLTAEERRKFSLWLRQDADCNEKLIEQLQTLPHANPIVQAKRRGVAAALIVATALDATEEFTTS